MNPSQDYLGHQKDNAVNRVTKKTEKRHLALIVVKSVASVYVWNNIQKLFVKIVSIIVWNGNYQNDFLFYYIFYV